MEVDIADIVRTLKRIHDQVDPDTEDHAVRTGTLAVEIGKRINGKYKKLSDDRLDLLGLTATVHDWGKIFLDQPVLRQATSLTRAQRVHVQEHTLLGFDALEFLNLPNEFGFGILYHHEHWDGSGYPRHLKGREIPLFPRILCISDVWDAITSDRVYRKAMSHDKALHFMKQHGSWFEPRLLQIFLDVMKEGK